MKKFRSDYHFFLCVVIQLAISPKAYLYLVYINCHPSFSKTPFNYLRQLRLDSLSSRESINSSWFYPSLRFYEILLAILLLWSFLFFFLTTDSSGIEEIFILIGDMSKALTCGHFEAVFCFWTNSGLYSSLLELELKVLILLSLFLSNYFSLLSISNYCYNSFFSKYKFCFSNFKFYICKDTYSGKATISFLAYPLPAFLRLKKQLFKGQVCPACLRRRLSFLRRECSLRIVLTLFCLSCWHLLLGSLLHLEVFLVLLIFNVLFGVAGTILDYSVSWKMFNC